MAGDKTNQKRAKRGHRPAIDAAPASDEEMEREIRRLYESINAELTVLEERADRLLKSRIH